MGRDQHRLSATTTCSSLPKLIAEKSIPDPSGAGQVVQSWAAPLVVRNGGSGGAGRVRGADGRQRWVRAVDLRPASGSQRH